MKSKFRPLAVAIYSIIGTAVVLIVAQILDFPGQQQEGGRRQRRAGAGFGRPSDRPNRRPGGGGFGAIRQDFALRKQFDKNNDNILDSAERRAAREFLQKERTEGRGPRRGPSLGGRSESSRTPGKKIAPADVQVFAKEPLYDPAVVRTIFIEFEDSDWERELDEFYHTDADLPAKVTVDGATYSDVGVHFHGASSYFTLRELGMKASLVLSMDMAHEKQNLLGYRTLDLLDAHSDPSFLHTVLYLQTARDYIPAAKANFARVVINGENWGIYVNAEHFNKDLVREWFPKSKGARWKVPGSPRGQGGLNYLGEDIEAYKSIYEIKTKDDRSSWQQLIRLCRVLSETEPNKLETELNRIFDVDGALKFLALENALINSDGYWIRSSDYNLCQDEQSRFHIIPHDANETFAPAERPGSGSRSGGEEPKVTLSPTAGEEDSSKPLLSRLLAAPTLRSRYFGYMRQIAEHSLDWNKLGPIAAKYHNMIAEDVKLDTKKLYPYEAFEESLGSEVEDPNRGPRRFMALKTFVEKRRAFLLERPEVKKATLPLSAK
jgi:hypothetical protein